MVQDVASSGGQEPPVPPTRRKFLLAVGLALNAVVAVLVAIPVLGYLLGPIRRRTAQSWILLGPIEEKPAWPRMRIPFVSPGTGQRQTLPAGSDDSRASNSKCLPSTVRTSAALYAGSHPHGCSCAPAMAGCTMKTAHTPPARRRVACTSMTTRSVMASSGSKADRFQRSPNPCENEDDDAPHLSHSQLV